MYFESVHGVPSQGRTGLDEDPFKGFTLAISFYLITLKTTKDYGKITKSVVVLVALSLLLIFLNCLYVFHWICIREGFPKIPSKYPLKPPKSLPYEFPLFWPLQHPIKTICCFNAQMEIVIDLLFFLKTSGLKTSRLCGVSDPGHLLFV